MSDALVSRPEATVDLAAYARNLALVRERVAPAEVMAVVKADAYGHGLSRMVRAASDAGIRWFGSLDMETAMRVRDDAPDASVFAWLLGSEENYRAALEARIELGVSTLSQLEEIADAATATPARVHLKIDTGLHRNGATAEDWPELVARAVQLERSGVVELAGVWTHISEASDEDDTAAIACFDAAIAVAESLGATIRLRHLAASAASFARADSRFDLVRIGAFGYGIAPGGGVGPADLGLTAVMTLSAPVFAVDDGLAHVAIGSGDGISTAAAGAVSIAIGGARHPIVGVGLDWTTVDVGDAEVRSGDTAILFGDGGFGEQTLQEWADALGTIGEELVTRLSPEVPRRYVD